jgi:NADH-quinone oxidoreductase subunit N
MMIPFNPADLIAIQPELVLLGATCAILLIDLFIKPSQRDITHWLSIATLALTSYLVWRGAPELSSGVTAFNGMFLHDGISVVLKQFILLTSGTKPVLCAQLHARAQSARR